GLGEGLGAEYGGPRGLELVVTNGDLIVARSIDPDRWAAVPMPPAFGSTASAGEVGPDVTGIERIYGSAAVPELGWTVQAGAELEATVTGANERALRTG